jgi:hypothetical protein
LFGAILFAASIGFTLALEAGLGKSGLDDFIFGFS